MRTWIKNGAKIAILVTAFAGAAGLFLRLHGKRGEEDRPQEG